MRTTKLALRALTCATAFACAGVAHAESVFDTPSGRLLLTGGVSTVEGAAGGGLTPWAIIAGYGTKDQIGGNAYFTHLETDDFGLDSYGFAVGLYDRVELSISRQQFDVGPLSGALGVDSIDQTTYGLKVRVLGDAILEQDSWVPQIAVGVQYKDNDEDNLLENGLGIPDADGTDFYVSATKLFLGQSLLLNGTVRFTRANEFGILGHGGPDDDYETEFEGSAAYLLNRKWAIGAEFRTKPNKLDATIVGDEETAYDAFVAFAPTKNVSATLAYVDLGNVVVGDQAGLYASLQVGF